MNRFIITNYLQKFVQELLIFCSRRDDGRYGGGPLYDNFFYRINLSIPITNIITIFVGCSQLEVIKVMRMKEKNTSG